MNIIAYCLPNPKDKNWFNLLIQYGSNGMYYKVVSVENLGGLRDILVNGQIKTVQTREELDAMCKIYQENILDRDPEQLTGE